MSQHFLESSYSTAYQQMSKLLKSVWPNNAVREKELRMFACSLAMVGWTSKAGDNPPDAVTAELDQFVARKLSDFTPEEIATFQQRFHIYRAFIIDVLSEDMDPGILWSESSGRIVEMGKAETSQGYLQGSLGIIPLIGLSFQGGRTSPPKPSSGGGCAVILLLIGAAAVSSTLIGLFPFGT